MSEIYGIFKPDTLTVRQIFDGTNYYQIPDYQRPYSWTDDQIEQFWDDIYTTFENNKNEPYFLGPVILAKNPENPDRLEVVDGQQRLTTLTILFCVVRDLYFKDFSGEEGNILKNRILNAIESLVDRKYRLRLITQAHYQNIFEQEILRKVNFPDRPFTRKEKQKVENRLMNAALMFKDRLAKINDVKKIQDFVRYLLERVVMITITCSNRVSAIRLFQVINTRGLELSTADLIKSYLYSQLAEDKKEQFNYTWRNIEGLAEDNDETVTDLLTYYGYYLLARKPQKSLYEELEQEIKNRDANEVVYEFEKFSKQYDEIINKKSKIIYSLRYLPDKVFWKTILVTAKRVNFTEFDTLCKELRRLYYSYWIAGYTTAKTRNLSFSLIKMIKDRKTFSDIKEKIDEKMKDDKVVDYVAKNLSDDVYGSSWLKPLLILVEYEQTDASVFIEYGRNLHVDHILPEKWYEIEYWRKLWTKERADFWLNKIGNLTLLSGRKNIKASNRGFPEKKEIYEGKGLDGITGFIITQRIIRENNDWTEDEVKKRQDWLIEEIGRILDIELTSK
ncbi:MAG: DUF262 domain-containing protein [Candidatus Heimdallarchaeaceae archaeon]